MPSMRELIFSDIDRSAINRQEAGGDSQIEGADAVAHGSTGKGNDRGRFELTYYALNPYIRGDLSLEGMAV